MKQKAERAEQFDQACHFGRDIVVKKSGKLGATLKCSLDLIETIIKCDFDKLPPLVTNGEKDYRLDVSKVLFAPREGSNRKIWTYELAERRETDPMFVNGLYARHETRYEAGDNLHAQLIKLFPNCQFDTFLYEAPIERPVFVLNDGKLQNRNLLNNRNVGGVVVTNCTQKELTKSRRSHKLTFAIDKTQLSDLKMLNMSHCFKGTQSLCCIIILIITETRTLDDFLPSIQSVPLWPETDFSLKATIYNQIDLRLLKNLPYCEQNGI